MQACFIFVAGLTIELNGVSYVNNSEISITEVGEGDNAMLCRTDLTNCCDRDQGEWIYPNNTIVKINNVGYGFYRNRGAMLIRLHKRNGVTRPPGLYCCALATENDPDATICINLSKFSR